MRNLRTCISLLFIFVLLPVAVSCSVSRGLVHGKGEAVTDGYEFYNVMHDDFRDLLRYEHEGLLDVKRIVRYSSPSGFTSYGIKYRFRKRYITEYDERMSVMKQNFPELYDQFRYGRISLNSLYEYVDDDGGIKYHISYYDK